MKTTLAKKDKKLYKEIQMNEMSLDDLRGILFPIANQKMTVRELRHKLFSLSNTDEKLDLETLKERMATL